MMKQYLFKTTGLAALVLLLQLNGRAQSDDARDTADDRLSDYDEIVIKHKSSKDAKVTVEIRDNKVYVNGKRIDDFDTNDLSVRLKKIKILDGQSLTFAAPGEEAATGVYMSPFRSRIPRKMGGAKNLHGQAWNMVEDRAFLGVTTDRPEKDGVKGAEIHKVSPGSAAEKVGLKEGDIITRVDEIVIDGPESLSEAVQKYKPENKVTLTVLRGGKEQKMTVKLGKAPGMNVTELYRAMPDLQNFNFDFDGAPGAQGFGNFGPARPRLGIKAQDTEDGKGVKVLQVGDESAAEKAGIKEGDIITQFDGHAVTSATELSELARASKEKPLIKVSLIRDGKTQEMEIKIPKKLKTADL